jgi:hypothetical protein
LGFELRDQRGEIVNGVREMRGFDRIHSSGCPVLNVEVRHNRP